MLKKYLVWGFILLFLCLLPAVQSPAYFVEDWTTPLNLSNTPADSQQPHLKNQDGALYLAWLEPSAEGGVEVYFTERPAGGLTWTTPLSLSRAASQTATKIRLEAAADDTLHVVWQATDPIAGVDHVYYAYRPAGEQWREPEQLSGSSNAVLNDAKVAPEGSAHALWEEETVSGAILLYAGRPPGLAWSLPLTLDLTAEPGAQAELAIGADNHLHAVWTSQAALDAPLVYAERPPGVEWTSPILIDSGPVTYSQLREQSGYLYAAWVEQAGGGDELHFAERAPGGAWTVPASVAGPYSSIRGPLLNVTPPGRPQIAWIGRPKSANPQNVYFLERLADGGWAAKSNLSEYTNETASISRLRLDSHTLLIGHVAWVGRADDSSVAQVFHRARLLSGEWTAAEAVSASAVGAEAGLALVVDSDGQVHVVWEDTTPGAIDLFYAGGGAVPLSNVYLPAVLSTADPR